MKSVSIILKEILCEIPCFQCPTVGLRCEDGVLHVHTGFWRADPTADFHAGSVLYPSMRSKLLVSPTPHVARVGDPRPHPFPLAPRPSYVHGETVRTSMSHAAGGARTRMA